MNTQEDIQKYLSSLNDTQVLECLATARDDILAISGNELNSEWHEACFAGLLTYAQEAAKRGLKVAK